MRRCSRHSARNVALAVAVSAAALLLAPAVAAAASHAASGQAASVASSSLGWKLARTVVNPENYPNPQGSSVAARAGRIDWQVAVAPQVVFSASYPAPPPTLTAGRRYELPVTLTGQISGGKDTPGYRQFDVILYLYDRWVDPLSGSSPSLKQECGAPSFGAPIACSSPGTLTGKLDFLVPTPQKLGDTFSFGVGALNCTRCYVRYEYQATGLSPAPAAGPKPPFSSTPERLTLGDLRRAPEYRAFLGLDDARIPGSFEWAKVIVGRCSDLVGRATGFAGVTSAVEIPGETSSGQHSASVFGVSDFHDLLDSSLPPSDLKGNVFVAATKRSELALRAAIDGSEGNLAPADVLYLALRLEETKGSYPLAVLTTLNLLKEVAFQGREAVTVASRLVRAKPRSAAAIAKEHELFERQLAILRSQNKVVSKLVSLRQNPLLGQDKMGPWYHAFTILTVGALYRSPIPKGNATAFWEHFRKAIGAFGTSEAPFNPEKATLDFCFAQATDSEGLSKLSR